MLSSIDRICELIIFSHISYFYLYLSADGLYAADEEDRPEVKHVEGVIREEGRVISGENVDDL